MSPRLSLLLILVLGALTLAGCVGCQDPMMLYGANVSVSEREESAREPVDDRIEEKHPTFVSGRNVEEVFGSCDATLNKSSSVVKLDIVPLEPEEREALGALFPTRAGAVRALVAANPSNDLLPSMEVVNGSMKPFNDGLYAAVELAAQDGLSGVFIGKRALLQQFLAAARSDAADPALARYREALDEGVAYVAAALELSGSPVSDLSADLRARTDRWVAGFTFEKVYSKPTGFYTWSVPLGRIFQQDRFLQASFIEEPSLTPRDVALAAVLARHPELQDPYETAVTLYTGMTGRRTSAPLSLLAERLPLAEPYSGLDQIRTLEAQFPLPPCHQPRVAFLPSSTSKDVNFTCSHEGGGSVMNALIGAIRSGAMRRPP